MPLLNRQDEWESGMEQDMQPNRNAIRNARPDAVEEILRRTVEREAPGARTVAQAGPKRGGMMQNCANPECRTGWMQLWRSRSGPVFEGGSKGGWTCSADCTEALVRAAVLRESKGRTAAREPYRHRIPLGLLMLEKGWITENQLRSALASQKQHGGRLGGWLVRQQGVSADLVTRALALQWSCPVLSTGAEDAERLAALVPRLFVDAFGAVPLRLAAGKVLYLGFQDRLDPVLARAIERMTDLRVECGVVADAEFDASHERALRAKHPPVELVEAANEEMLARALARSLEKAKPAEARLVRVHDFLWLRMMRKADASMRTAVESGAVGDVIADVIGTVAG